MLEIMTIPDFKLYYKAVVKNKQTNKQHGTATKTDQWNRIEDPERSPHSYSHLIFNKGAKTLCWRKDNFFNKWCWKNCIFTYTRLKTGPYVPPYTKLIQKESKTLMYDLMI
jgi:hypothetical protein